MHQILEKLMKKRGIRGIDDLKGEEKDTFDEWNVILSAEDELEPQKMAEFCKAMIGEIERKWSDVSLEDRAKIRLIDQHTVYSKMLAVIESPKRRRKDLERSLRQMLEA